MRSIVRCFASPRNDVFQTAKLHRHCERTKQSSRVGWAKALLRRAHRSRRARQGGHASLCPPCGFRRHTLSFSRRDFRLSFTNSLLPLEQRAQGKPGADCARSTVCEKCRENTHGFDRYSRDIPAFPAQWFDGLYVLSPVSGLYCHRCRARTGGPDRRQGRGARTTRFRRTPRAPLVNRATASIASHRTVRDDREPPLAG